MQELLGIQSIPGETHFYTTQGHSCQIWAGSALARTLYPRGAWGHAPPEKLGTMRLLLRPFLGQYDAFRRPDD